MWTPALRRFRPGEGYSIINTLQTAAYLWSTRTFASTHALESSRLIHIALTKIRLAGPTLCRISCPVSTSTLTEEAEVGQEWQQIDEENLEGLRFGEIGPKEWNATPATDWVC